MRRELQAMRSALAFATRPRKVKKRGAGHAGPVVTPQGSLVVYETLQRQLPPGGKFWLVVVADDAAPTCTAFDDVRSLVQAVKTMLNMDAYVWAFAGQQMGITLPPHRFLVTNVGSLPLFDVPGEADLKVDSTGWVGKPPVTLPAPAASSNSPEPKESDDTEDAEDDGTELMED